MKLVHPALEGTITFGEDSIPCIVIENKKRFRSFICDMSAAIEGINTKLVLSQNEKMLDISKNVEIITDFINFDINRKALLNKMIAELEKTAVSPDHYLNTQELLSEIERRIEEWTFSFSCDIVPSKISVSTLLKASGIELRNDYKGDTGEVEKILDYMELVREFDREKLFVTVNMRTFFDDVIWQFQKTAISHDFKVLMLESQAYPKLDFEKLTTIDVDLCEF